jgi:hypothetical protein
LPFKKAYLEPSIINRAYGCGLSGLKLKEVLAKHLLTPAIGLNAIYEMARTFLNKDGVQIGVALFKILWELDPSYQLSPEMLYDQEIIKLRIGAAVLPFLDELNLAATKQEVWRIASGNFDEKASNSITSREAEIRENHPKFALNYIKEVNETLKSNPSERLPTFEKVYSDLGDQLPGLIYKLLEDKLSIYEAHEIYHRIDSFPAIRTTLRSNVYLNAICIIHQHVPGKDKIDDYRHIIEASYCDIFVTDDAQLSRTIPRINPDLQVLSGNQFFQ